MFLASSELTESINVFLYLFFGYLIIFSSLGASIGAIFTAIFIDQTRR